MKLPEGPGLVDNRYQEGDPATALAATTLRAVDMNALTYEIINVIEGAGLALDPGREDQLLEAITKMIEENLAPDASETAKGIVELATAQETETGTDNTRAVTPAAAQATYLKRSQNLAGLADVAAARGNLGFSDPILNKAAPGDIGAITPGFGYFDHVYVGTGTGSTGGNNNLIKPKSNNAWLNLKGGAGRAKIGISNDGVSVVAGNSGEIVFFTDAADATNMGTQRANLNASRLLLNVGLSVGGGATIAQVLSALATLNFGNLGPGESATRTMTVSGASAGDPVFIGISVGQVIRQHFYVSASNQVTIYMENTSTATTYDLTSVPVRAVVFKY